jgi:hypothetical protein
VVRELKKEMRDFLFQKRKRDFFKTLLKIYERIPKKLVREFAPRMFELSYKFWGNKIIFDLYLNAFLGKFWRK